ncbi:MAG TPA: DNA mismatch repair endonuclease MutL [Anaerolineales bacterium]|nr:DNA mismatch repair endonuclease MutL [Anaerolineales bacterium]
MPIHVLPESVASSIAAGEVIERPASVIKELIENALDAGARRIDLRIEGAGQDLLEVADDGIGIPSSELTLAVARYATSKLETAEDLYALKSLGFRGEALASIGAVSRMEIVSRTPEVAGGAKLLVEGGKVGEPTVTSSPVGTRVRVRDLFFNLPARRKFLKSETAERRRIHEIVGRYAFGYPSVAFQLSQDDRMVLQTSGDGDRRQALAASIGVEAARQMLALPRPADAPVQVEGLIGPPSVHRANRRELTFFVNGHWIQDAGLAAAVIQAYHGLLMVGRYPTAYLWLQVLPEDVDINVHPGKAEVRFRQPDAVFSAVQRAVRATLLHQAGAPEVDLGSTWSVQAREILAPPSRADGLEAAPSEADARPLSLAMFPAPSRPSGALPLLRPVGQVGAAYLVAEGPDGLYLIDQHAAHERILFEALSRSWSDHRLEVQSLLDPQPVTLTPADEASLTDLLPALQRIGIEVEPFGGGTVRVRSLPAIIARLDPAEVLRTVIGRFEEDEAPLAAEVEARLAARVCKRAAVKAGQVLSLVEQQRLVSELEACQSPRTCPHGRPTMIHLSVDTLERQFGRRG